MKLKYCEVCKNPLWNVGGKFYMHPSLPCTEKDGLEIKINDNFLFENFRKKYGTPEKSFEEYFENKGVLKLLKKKYLQFLEKIQ